MLLHYSAAVIMHALYVAEAANDVKSLNLCIWYTALSPIHPLTCHYMLTSITTGAASAQHMRAQSN